jgi:WD40 repeat protein
MRLVVRVLQSTGTRSVDALQFGREGRTLFAAWRDGFDVWNLDAEGHEFVPWEKTNTLFAFVLDPLDRWLYISGGKGGLIHEWRTQVERRFPGMSNDNHMISIAASPDGSRVAMSRGPIWSNRIECWEVGSDGAMSLGWSVPTASQGVMAHAVAFSPDAGRLATVEGRPASRPGRDPMEAHFGLRKTLAIRDATTGAELDVIGTVSEELSIRVTYTQDGTRLLVRYPENIEVWDIAARTTIGRIQPPGRSRFRDLALLPRGRVFATASGDGTVRLRDSTSLQELRALKWGIGKPHSVAFSPDGTVGAAGGDKGQIVVWDVDI